MIGKLRSLRNAILSGRETLSRVSEAQDAMLMLAGQSAAFAVRQAGRLKTIQDAEFKVFSQFGDDGIIQYLIASLRLKRSRFVEFGVENYREANTRFLLRKDDWAGLVIDGSETNIREIQQSSLMWRHNFTAVAAFITRENINQLISNAGFSGDLGILSIDIDGNDYFVWQNIDCVNPAIVIAEYNSVFGVSPVSIPYDPAFVRTKAHSSNLYWGCSIGALEHLGREKGYALVGSNSAGNNVYFVRQDLVGELDVLSASEAYVESQFRESRDPQGMLTFLTGKARNQAIGHLPLVNVVTGKSIRVAELP
jgi:hypothetical protein